MDPLDICLSAKSNPTVDGTVSIKHDGRDHTQPAPPKDIESRFSENYIKHDHSYSAQPIDIESLLAENHLLRCNEQDLKWQIQEMRKTIEQLKNDLSAYGNHNKVLKSQIWSQESFTSLGKEIIANELVNASRKPKNRLFSQRILHFRTTQHFFSSGGMCIASFTFLPN